MPGTRRQSLRGLMGLPVVLRSVVQGRGARDGSGGLDDGGPDDGGPDRGWLYRWRLGPREEAGQPGADQWLVQ